MILLNPSLLLASPVQDRAVPESGWDGFKSSTAPLCAVGSDIALMGSFTQSGLHFLYFLWGQVSAHTTAALCPCYLCSASSLQLSRGRLVPFCCVQAELRDPLPAWALAQSRNESFLPCLQPPYAVISYLTHQSFQFTFFLQNYGFSVVFLPLKELLGMTLPSNNPGRGLRCVNLRPVADQNAPWCLFTVHQFRHQLRSCSLLNVDKSPCIKFNLRFIRRDLKQERHLSRNWKKKPY